MIQRIQSLYFLFIVILIFLMLAVPLSSIEAGSNIYTFSVCPFLQDTGQLTVSFLPLCIYLAVNLIFTIIVLFLFKNRVLQIKMAKLNGILLAVLIALVVMAADFAAADILTETADIKVNYDIGTYLCFFPLILNYLAIKRIRKDEELVRSADRLR